MVELHQPILQNLEDAESRKLATVSGSRSPEDTQEAVNIQNSLTQAQGLLNQIRFFTDHQRLWQATESLQADAAQVRELLFQEALIASRKLLVEYTELDYCPVCLQQIDRLVLLNSLEKRVRNAQTIEEKSSAIKLMRDNLAIAIQSQLTQSNQLDAQALSLKLSRDTSQIEPYNKMLSVLASFLIAEPVEMHLPAFNELVANPVISRAEKQLQDLIASLLTEKSRLEPTEQDKLTVSIIDLLTRVIDSRKALRDFQPRLNAKEATYREMCAIYECFVSTKRDEIKNIYQDLEGDIRRYFKILHENEGYQEIRLDVDESKRASTEIKMDFHDRPHEDPRAFNSEGHLRLTGIMRLSSFCKTI